MSLRSICFLPICLLLYLLLAYFNMCTVTYYPAQSGFILTHNRDEAPTRSPQTISRVKNQYRSLLFPRDTRAGGAWIVAANTGQTACLLNGAFIKHHHQPPYRRSRGLVLLDCLEAGNPLAFLDDYDYTGIEPFTLLLFSKQQVRELRWDGTDAHHKNLPIDQPHFWCSATLYPAEMQQQREQVFRHWLPGHCPTAAALLSLHRQGSVQDPENDFVMNRGGRVQTVSITQVVQQATQVHMRYFDLLQSRQDVRAMTLRPEMGG